MKAYHAPPPAADEDSRLGSVAFVIEGDETYGVRRMTLTLAEGLLRNGSSVTAIALRDGELAQALSRAGCSVQVCKYHKIPALGQGRFRKLLSLLSLAAFGMRSVPTVASHLKKLARGTAVIVRMPRLVPIAGLAARFASLRSYWIMPNAVSDGYPFDLNRRLYSLLFATTGMLPVANSHYTRTTLGKGAADRAKVLHLGIDPKEFPIKAESMPNPNINKCVAGVFARLVPEKGQLVLLQAIASDPSLSDVSLLIAGGPLSGPYYSELVDAISSLNLSNRVTFAGPINIGPDLYHRCDIIINSRLDAEPFGLSIIESMMSGVPVLAHALGGPSETIVDGVTGWLVHRPEAPHLAEGLRRVLRDRGRWREMGNSAAAHARTTFSTEAMIKRLSDLIATQAGQ